MLHGYRILVSFWTCWSHSLVSCSFSYVLFPSGSSSKKEKHQDPDVTPPYINGSVMDKNEGENEWYGRGK